MYIGGSVLDICRFRGVLNSLSVQVPWPRRTTVYTPKAGDQIGTGAEDAFQPPQRTTLSGTPLLAGTLDEDLPECRLPLQTATTVPTPNETKAEPGALVPRRVTETNAFANFACSTAEFEGEGEGSAPELP